MRAAPPIKSSIYIYNPATPLGRHLMRDEFNPDDLKREKITVYVVIPSNRRKWNYAWLGLVLATIAEAVGKPSKSAPVLLIAEEFANLGYLPSIPSAMAEYREAGLKVHLIIQALSQLDSIYGPKEAQNIITQCSLRQFFMVSDLMLAEALSRSLGTYTSYERDEQERIVKKTQMPLATASQILNMPRGEQIILVTGDALPIHCKMPGYWEMPHIARHVDANPIKTYTNTGARTLRERLRRFLKDTDRRISEKTGELAEAAVERTHPRLRPAARHAKNGLAWGVHELRLKLRNLYAPPSTFHAYTELEHRNRFSDTGIWSPWVKLVFFGFLILVAIELFKPENNTDTPTTAEKRAEFLRNHPEARGMVLP